MYRFELTYASITTVVSDPQGWDTLSISFERDALLNGFLFGFSPQGASLGFYGDGYGVLKGAYDSEGIEAEVLISIYYTSETPEVELFTGRCNMGTLNFDLKLCIAQVEVETYDVLGQVRSGLNTKLNLLATEGVDGTALAQVPALTDVEVQAQDLLRVTEIGRKDRTVTYTPTPGVPRLDALNSTIVFQDEVAYNLASPEVANNAGTLGTNVNFPAAATWDFEWSIDSFEIAATLGPNPGPEIDIRAPGLLASLPVTLLETPPASNIYVGTNLSGSTTFVTAGPTTGQIYLRIPGVQGLPQTVTIVGYRWRISRRLEFPGTSAKCLFIHEATQAALNILTNGGIENTALVLRSELMGKTDTQFPPTPDYVATGDAALLTITDGLALREFAITELNASLNDLLKTVVTLYAAGAGLTFDTVVPELRVEGLQFFFDRSQTVFILDIYDEQSLTPDLDRIYTQVIQGFRRFDVETFSGFFDINNSQTWSATTRAPENVLENITPLIGSSYIIEFVRRQTVFDDGAVSTTYDKDLFGLMVEPNMGGYRTQKQAVLSFFGTPTTVDVRNADIHPTRSLLRWLPFVNSSLRNQSVEGVREYSRDATADPVYAGLVTESPLITYTQGDLVDADLFFAPELLQITTPLDTCQLQAFKASPYAQVSVLLGGLYTYWFIQAVEFGLGENTVNWTLLRSRTASTTLPPITIV